MFVFCGKLYVCSKLLRDHSALKYLTKCAILICENLQGIGSSFVLSTTCINNLCNRAKKCREKKKRNNNTLRRLDSRVHKIYYLPITIIEVFRPQFRHILFIRFIFTLLLFTADLPEFRFSFSKRCLIARTSTSRSTFVRL